MLVQIIQGRRWTYNGDHLRKDNIKLNTGHYLQERCHVKYVVSQDDIADCNVLDRYAESAGQGGDVCLCSRVDLIIPGVYIADVYEWAEGVDKFLAEGTSSRTFRAKVLLISSREHFLNQNFLRLLSILPLMLQARQLHTLSLYASIVIIVLDQLSYQANLVWKMFVDLMVDLAKFLVSRIKGVEMRQYLSTFMASVSPRLAFTDQVRRNFYRVRKNEAVLLFGTSCASEFLDTDSLQDVPAPDVDQLNPVVKLSDDEYRSFNDTYKRKNAELKDISDVFGITAGSGYVEHHVEGGRIMTFLKPEDNAYYNFLDYDHLHFGVLEEGQQYNIRKALKWIENNGGLPVACNHKGKLRAVAFNDFVDKVGKGYGILRATVKKTTWV